MHQTGDGMSKVNTKVKYDPDFGSSILPDIDSIYQVTVTPHVSEGQKRKNKWIFFLFMPRITDDEDNKYLLMVACESLLNLNDSYKVESLDIDSYDQEKLKYIPCASFDPDNPREFFWLTPPHYIWH